MITRMTAKNYVVIQLDILKYILKYYFFYRTNNKVFYIICTHNAQKNYENVKAFYKKCSELTSQLKLLSFFILKAEEEFFIIFILVGMFYFYLFQFSYVIERGN